MLHPSLVLNTTRAVLSQEINLHLESEGSIRRQEISNNTSRVEETFPISPVILSFNIFWMVDISGFFGGLKQENSVLEKIENILFVFDKFFLPRKHRCH